MIRAGDLKDRITLERHDTATDSWLPLELVPKIWTQATAQGDQQYEFSIRYHPEVIDLQATQPAMRVVWERPRGQIRILELINVAESDDRMNLVLTARGHRVVVGDISSTARQTTKWP